MTGLKYIFIVEKTHFVFSKLGDILHIQVQPKALYAINLNISFNIHLQELTPIFFESLRNFLSNGIQYMIISGMLTG